MDYVSMLTEEEIGVLCRSLPLHFFRDYFKDTPQKFHKICSSCRAEKVSMELVERLAVKYRNTPYIADLLNDRLQMALEFVAKGTKTFTDTGEDIHTALLHVLPESPFSQQIGLYFKLSGQTYTPEYVELLKSALKELKAAKQDGEPPREPADDAPEDRTADLRQELEEANRRLEEQKAKAEAQNTAFAALHEELRGCQETLWQKEQELSGVQLKLDHAGFCAEELEAQKARAETQDKALVELRAELRDCQERLWKKEQELRGLQRLMDRADYPEDDSLAEEYPYVSLCQIDSGSGGNISLRRLADVTDGVLQTQWREDFPSRSYLYTKNSFMLTGSFGIWGWRIGYDPESGRDGRISSSLLKNLVPVQIIVLPDCWMVEELKDALLRGKVPFPDGERTLFTLKDREKYTGLLCETKDLLRKGRWAALKPNVVLLNLYEFTEQDIVKIGRSWFFYRVTLGVPQEIIQLTDPLDIVKQLLREGPATMKQLRPVFGGTNAQKIREFLSQIPTADFYQKTAGACGCSIDEAKAYVNDFIQRADVCLREEDIGTEVLEAALEHNGSLLEKCRMLNETQWREEHTEQIQRARTELEQVTAEVRKAQRERGELAGEKERLEAQRNALSASVAQQEQLAEEVERKVALRIEAAKKNAADFICEMAFVRPETPAFAAPGEAPLFQPGEDLDGELFQLRDVQDAAGSIRDELEEAGVSEQYASHLAAFLYAAYRSGVPLLLAGPNGRDIADAFSAALFGRTASVLRCGREYQPSAVEACLGDDGGAAAVLNPLRPGWVEQLPELAARKEKFLMLVHPFAEDLLMEPRGLYNYVLPVLTELFVDRTPDRKFSGGRFSKEFSRDLQTKPLKTIPFMEKLAMPPLTRNRLRQVLAAARAISRTNSPETDFLFGSLPYGYVTGRSGVLLEALSDTHTISKDAKALFLSFLGEPE